MKLVQISVTSATNLSSFIVNLCHYLLAQFCQNSPGSGIVDLKAYYHGFILYMFVKC
jgi:hypothetical protein